MKIKFLWCITLLGILPFLTSNAQEKDADPTLQLEKFKQNFVILPSPKTINILQGEGLNAGDLKTILFSDKISRFPLGNFLKRLKLTGKSEEGTVVLELTNSNVPKSTEGYSLTVTANQVSIKSSSKAGLFYGCQTLEQLMEDALAQNINIPPMEIVDFPGIAYRPIHLDTKHHLDNMKSYYDLVDRLSRLKVNAIIWELEDKLRYREYAMVGAENAIGVQEMAALSNYAKARNVEISPLIQGLGHASFILKHEELKYLRDNPESDWAFCPLNPDTYKVQFSLYQDAIDATPHGKYLHIGGDEVGKLGMSALSKASGKTPFELQMHWLRKVSEFAAQHNRTPIFWDDMVLKRAGLYKTTYDESLTDSDVDNIWKENGENLMRLWICFQKTVCICAGIMMTQKK